MSDRSQKNEECKLDDSKDLEDKVKDTDSWLSWQSGQEGFDCKIVQGAFGGDEISLRLVDNDYTDVYTFVKIILKTGTFYYTCYSSINLFLER